jgi:galactoside O-acetyltransferase
MDAQELYTDVGPGLEALEESRVRGKELAREYNALEPRDLANRERVLRELFGTLGTGVWVEPPLFVAYGAHTHLGSSVYLNTGATIVDDSPVHLGDRVMFGPHVTLATAGHPLHPEVRATGLQFSAPIVIEDDVWIGAHATVLPGVTIGRGSVVAAGAVVHADVPPWVVVGGVPAKVLRTITEADREFVYRAPRSLDAG